ncbi:MAG: YcxB family protein [Pirellulales bacterium]
MTEAGAGVGPGAVTVSGRVSFGEQYRATRRIVARSRAGLMAYLFFLGSPLVLAILVASTNGVAALLYPPLAMTLLMGPFGVFVLFPVLHALNVRRMRSGNPAYDGVFTFVVSHDGFEVHGENFDVKLRWAAIRRVVETDEFLLFYVASTTAYFVPKKCVGAGEELRAMRKVIRAETGEKARLLGDNG